ncbi:unnamed protein product [Rotaria sp. Silwood1]|nr:unnamed protein product [Rotaria sp. Silwood1]CAF5082522.1 unnamed protein product [Rotaria sp. Silwood1]
MAKSLQSGEHSRFSDLLDEPVDHLLLPIKGYQDKPLVPLIEAVQPVSQFFNEIEDNVFVALHNCQNPDDKLTRDESASIHLYTMHFDDGPSLYLLLNRSLRGENREALKPWFSFFKLFMTALYKLPSQSVIVWRGVRDIDLSSKYKTGTKFAWWGVISCTTNMEVLESDQILGKHGQRTLFSIECINGKSVASHSYFKNAEKEIILMPGSYFEVTGQVNPAPELHIIHLKEITPPITLIKPPFSKSINISSPSIPHKPSTVAQSVSKMSTQNSAADVFSVEISSKSSTSVQSTSGGVTLSANSNTIAKEISPKLNAVAQPISSTTIQNTTSKSSSKSIPPKLNIGLVDCVIDIIGHAIGAIPIGLIIL